MGMERNARLDDLSAVFDEGRRIEFEMVMPLEFSDVPPAGIGISLIDPDEIEIPIQQDDAIVRVPVYLLQCLIGFRNFPAGYSFIAHGFPLIIEPGLLYVNDTTLQ